MNEIGRRISAIIDNLKADIRNARNLINFVVIGACLAVLIIKLSPSKLSLEWSVAILTSAVGLLLVKAISNEWMMKTALRQPIQPVYQDWLCPEVENLLGSALRSITIVQSFVPDSVFLARGIATAARRLGPRDELEVKIYMLDPQRDWGASRCLELEMSKLWVKEIESGLDNNEEIRLEELLQFELPTVHAQRKKFEHLFETAQETLADNLTPFPRITLRFFAYRTAPAIKIYAIDNREFLFGWLGLDGRSTTCPCFHVSERSDNKFVLDAVRRLKIHLALLNRCSREILPGESLQGLARDRGTA